MENLNLGPKTRKDVTPEEKDIILEDLKRILKNQKLNNMFRKTFRRLVKRLEGFSHDLRIDYHIVLLNEGTGKRYSIIEGKKPSIASKPIEFGIVGATIQQNHDDYQSLFVQFKQNKDMPTLAYADSSTGEISDITGNIITEIMDSEDNLPLWDEKKKDFAIVATTIKSKRGKTIGACSIDFSSQTGSFPTFSFRKAEVEEIFGILYTFKTVFEQVVHSEEANLVKEVIETATRKGK